MGTVPSLISGHSFVETLDRYWQKVRRVRRVVRRARLRTNGIIDT